MRFSTLFTVLTATSLVAAIPAPEAAPVAAPVPAEFAHVIDTPADREFKIKDFDPTAPDGDRVIGRIWKGKKGEKSAPKPALQKREWYNCYGGGVWVQQFMLYNIKDKVCTQIGTWTPIGWGGEVTVEWSDYTDSNGNWHPVVDQNNQRKTAYWKIWAGQENWNWNKCYNTFFQLIWTCRGSNPDSAGGSMGDYSNGWGCDVWFR